MTAPGLLIDFTDAVLRVTIDRPSRMNAFDDATCAALIEALTTISDDTRAVIITGSGPSFSAGADILDLASEAPSSRDEAQAAAEHTMHRANDLVRAVIGCPVPVIAQVNGAAVGIGASLALASDLVYASDSAYFLLAFTKIGLMPDGGSSLLVPAAIGRARASAMMLLAERMTASDAQAAGLINAVVPAPELDARVEAAAQRIVRAPRRALELTKQSLTRSTLALLEDALTCEFDGQTELLTSTDFSNLIAASAANR